MLFSIFKTPGGQDRHPRPTAVPRHDWLRVSHAGLGQRLRPGGELVGRLVDLACISSVLTQLIEDAGNEATADASTVFVASTCT